MTDLYEFKIWAEGEARDADGRLLDADGNPQSDATEDNEDDQPLVGKEVSPG